MRGAVPLALAAAAGALLTGCGSSVDTSPEGIVRAWSAAIDRNDSVAAARLFSAGAEIVQSTSFTLDTQAAARAWNDALPCGGKILSLTRRGADVVAVFRLGDRPQHVCDGPGQQAAAVIRVEHGKIVLWHQTPPPPAPQGQAA